MRIVHSAELIVFSSLICNNLQADSKLIEEQPIERANLISAVRHYTKRRTRKKERSVDITVSSSENDKKILIRAINEPKSRTGYISVDTVRKMIDFLEKKNYDKGILIGKRFTGAAKRETMKANIELFSENISPNFKVERLYSTICSYVEKMCKAKCGKVPRKDSDCKGFDEGRYSCIVRLVSDNADFHHERMWLDFLERDLIKLLAIEKELKK